MTDSRNFQKHTNRNPIQRLLLARFHDAVAALVAQCAPGSILDVGSGEGFVAADLLRRQPDLRLTGVDGSAEAVKLAADAAPAARFARADVRRLPVATRSVDLGICLEVVEHLRRPELALDELGRVSRDWVLVSTPCQPFFAGMNAARLKNLRHYGDDPEHVQWWTGPAFVRFVQDTLPVEHVQYSIPWTIVLARPDPRRQAMRRA